MVNALVITDTSCLILLDKLQAMHLLAEVYPHIITTPQIAAEFGAELLSLVRAFRSMPASLFVRL